MSQAEGRRRKRPRPEGESLLPQTATYNASFMHRKPVTHVIVSTSCDFVMSASVDGHLKFWKRTPSGIDFVKTYRSHVGPVQGWSLNDNESMLVSIGAHDSTMKAICVTKWNQDSIAAISDKDTSEIHIVPTIEGHTTTSVATSSATVFKRHTKGIVTHICRHQQGEFLISTDTFGGIEFWKPDAEGGFPAATKKSTNAYLQFTMKSATDLYCLQKAKTRALALSISPSGEYLGLLCDDGQIRILIVRTGKLFKVIDESKEAQTKLHADVVVDEADLKETASSNKFLASLIHISSMEFNKRLTVEKTLDASTLRLQSLVFDPSNTFILYPTLFGIKIVDFLSNRLVSIVGRNEHGLRFLGLALSLPAPTTGRLVGLAPANPTGGKSGHVSPLLIATCADKNRIYVFSDQEAVENEVRDALNEAPTASELVQHTAQQQLSLAVKASREIASPNGLIRAATKASIHTTFGDIKIVLFPNECPKTVENFAVHAQQKYYDDVIFHRVIRGFMIQTGDPRGDGTGGESIWGGEFEDEIHRKLKHDRPYCVSMANAGPNSNGSQFFITTVPTPFLDGKHTVFGRVEEGSDVVHEIEQVRTNVEDKPLKDIRILTIRITSGATDETKQQP